jgi:hypothetical protein
VYVTLDATHYKVRIDGVVRDCATLGNPPLILPDDLADVRRMDENYKSHAPDTGKVRLPGMRWCSNPLMVRDRIPGFHENPIKTAVSPSIALRHRQATKKHKRQ